MARLPTPAGDSASVAVKRRLMTIETSQERAGEAGEIHEPEDGGQRQESGGGDQITGAASKPGVPAEERALTRKKT